MTATDELADYIAGTFGVELDSWQRQVLALSFDDWIAAGCPRPELGPSGRYYDGSPGRELVTCPNCGFPAPAAIGDHGPDGECGRRVAPGGEIRTDLDFGLANVAKLIIRETALVKPVFSSNDTRARMDDKHVPVPCRARAFRELVGEVMVPVGYEPSTEHARRGGKLHDVRTYRSLIHTPGDR